MVLFSCLLFRSLVTVTVYFMLPLLSCFHAIGSLVSHWFAYSLRHVLIGCFFVMCPVLFVISSHVVAFVTGNVLML